MNKKTIRIDPNILSFFVREGCLKEFSQFIYLKTLHQNSCIFNYSKRALAAESGIPIAQIDRLVKFFLGSGWCKMKDKHLVFNHVRNKTKHRDEIKFEVNGDWKRIKEDLQLKILQKQQHKFEVYKRLGVTLSNPRNGREYKAALKKADKMKILPKNFKLLPRENDFFKISMQKIAELLKCSVGSAYNLINKLRLSGRAFCIKHLPQVFPFSSARALKGVYGGGYYSNGNIIIVPCNQYDFNN